MTELPFAADVVEGIWQGDSLRVLILYEDFPCGVQAMEMVKQLRERQAPGSRPEVKIWRFDVLGIPSVREAVANAASDAELLIIAAHESGTEEFPAALNAWFDRWLEHRNSQMTVLVGLLDISNGSANGTLPRAAKLRQIGKQNRIDLFIQEERLGTMALETETGQAVESAFRVASGRAGITAQTSSSACW
jgi:hypothetical protein